MIFLIGNKCDLDAQRDVTYEEAKQFAEENGELWFVIHVSSVFSDICWQSSQIFFLRICTFWLHFLV